MKTLKVGNLISVYMHNKPAELCILLSRSENKRKAYEFVECKVLWLKSLNIQKYPVSRITDSVIK
jgi:hypothetical protein